MKAKKRTVGRANWAMRIIILACVGFAFVKVVQIRLQIDQQREKLATLEHDIAMAKLYNEDLTEKGSRPEEYLEQYLRGKGYVYSYDQVYQFSN